MKPKQEWPDSGDHPLRTINDVHEALAVKLAEQGYSAAVESSEPTKVTWCQDCGVIYDNKHAKECETTPRRVTHGELRSALEAWEKWAESWFRVIDGTMFDDSPFLIEYRSARALGRKALGKE